MKKTPEHNIACWLGCLEAKINEAKEQEYNKKALKKYEKYTNRMIEIMNGNFKKCLNTSVSLHLLIVCRKINNKMAAEWGKRADTVALIFIELDIFTPEERKHIIEIFHDLFATDAIPNPLAKGLSEEVDRVIDEILQKFELSGMSTHYGNIIKMMSAKYELINHFLDIKIFQILAKYISNANFEISSDSLSVLEEILFSEEDKVQSEVSIGVKYKGNIPINSIYFLFNRKHWRLFWIIDIQNSTIISSYFNYLLIDI